MILEGGTDKYLHQAQNQLLMNTNLLLLSQKRNKHDLNEVPKNKILTLRNKYSINVTYLQI
jgi:hypothetical protein